MSTHRVGQHCPACGDQASFLIDWHYSGLNDSIFNYVAEYFACPSCGFVFIGNISDECLAKFYSEECSYFEKSHFDITSSENVEKYAFYRKFITEIGLVNQAIVDVGCGRGGFLLWLNQNHWQANLIGVDIDLKSFPSEANSNKNGYPVILQEGKALALPFSDQTQALLTYFHVLEHIRNIDKVFKEAYRVLQNNGHILIEVPDAEHYQDLPVGTAFWLGIREHVNHFSACTLVKALQRYGFQVKKVSRHILPTPEFKYPSLIVLAQKAVGDPPSEISMSNPIDEFVVKSNTDLQRQADKIQGIKTKYQKITFWGCSSELFSLLPLLKFRDFVLCDASQIKQQSTYQNIPIQDPLYIPKEGALIIAPYLYGDAIEQAALKFGWKKDDVFRLH